MEIRRSTELKHFKELEGEYHYMGETLSGGDMMRLVLEDDGKWVALTVWASACHHLKPRDAYVGWTNSIRAERGEDWGQKFFCFRGRPPAEQPDAGEALRALRDFIRPFRDLLNQLLVGLLPDEKEERCVYSTITLFWTVVIGFIEHLHSRSPCAGCHANISSDLVRGFGVPPSWNLCLGTVPLAFAAGM